MPWGDAETRLRDAILNNVVNKDCLKAYISHLEDINATEPLHNLNGPRDNVSQLSRTELYF